jgi:hypothetical protein
MSVFQAPSYQQLDMEKMILCPLVLYAKKCVYLCVNLS